MFTARLETFNIYILIALAERNEEKEMCPFTKSQVWRLWLLEDDLLVDE